MGRTIASITQTWQEEEAALNRFKRALRKDDQVILDELLVMSRLHLAEASYASNLYPLDMYLIAILLEVYKQLKATQRQLYDHDQHKDQNAWSGRSLPQADHQLPESPSEDSSKKIYPYQRKKNYHN
jgi:hypothetical protein